MNNFIIHRGLYFRYNTLKLSGGVSVQIEYIVQHSYYNSTTRENDISLIKTATNMTLSQMNADRAKISPSPIIPGSQLNITGWGSTIYGSLDFSNDLQIANLIVADLNECNNTLGGKITPKMFCARSNPPYKCSTPGDRGGPGINSKKLFGIIITWEDCELYQGFEVFTDFYKYYHWVLKVIKNLYPTTTESAL